MKAIIGTNTSIHIPTIEQSTKDLAKLLAVNSKKWMGKYLSKVYINLIGTESIHIPSAQKLNKSERVYFNNYISKWMGEAKEYDD